MSNNANQSPYYDSLRKLLNQQMHASGSPGIRIATKRNKHSQRLAERIEKNAESIDKLIDIIKALNKKPGTAEEVDKLIDVAKDLLENNAKLREQVGEAIQDIPANG